MLLLAALVTGSIWVAGTLATLGGFFWTDIFMRSELFLPPALLAVGLGMVRHTDRRESFGGVYRIFGLLLLFWCVIWLAASGQGSVLPLTVHQVEIFYQLLGFLAAGLTIWYGIRRGWNAVTNTGVVAFTILLYLKATDWWWDWMPRWLFFLTLGAIAVAVMLVLRRLKTRVGEAA